MATTVTNIDELVQGDTWRFEAMSITDENNAAVDIQGCSLFFTLRTAVSDDAGVAISDPDDSEATVTEDVSVALGTPTYSFPDIVIPDTITSAVSLGKYYYDFQLKLSNGDILTLVRDKTKVVYQVTQRTA